MLSNSKFHIKTKNFIFKHQIHTELVNFVSQHRRTSLIWIGREGRLLEMIRRICRRDARIRLVVRGERCVVTLSESLESKERTTGLKKDISHPVSRLVSINALLTQVKIEKNENAMAACTLLTPNPFSGSAALLH